MVTDLERQVARILAGDTADDMVINQGGDNHPEWLYSVPTARKVLAFLHVGHAEAILAALREPSEAVVAAAHEEAAGHADEHLTEAKIRAAILAAVEAATQAAERKAYGR